MLRFVLCADDFALSEGVSQAILDVLRRGRISATSVMTNRPSWPEQGQRLKDMIGVADLGVHLNLTCGASLGVMSRFSPRGELPPHGRVLRLALTRRLPAGELADEFARQIDSFARVMGREPDFVDGHQHVHALPGVRGALLAALESLGLTRRVYVRDPGDRLLAIAARGVSAGKAAVVAALAGGFGALLRAGGIAANDGFSGVAPFDPGRDFAADFASFLRAPGPRHLVMCHPGYVDDELVAADPVGATRPIEHAFLAGDAFPAMLARLDASPARFHRLTEA